MQRLGYCLMEKMQGFYPTLTKFSQRRRKTYDANVLLTLSLVSMIVFIYSLGKNLYCTC